MLPWDFFFPLLLNVQISHASTSLKGALVTMPSARVRRSYSNRRRLIPEIVTVEPELHPHAEVQMLSTAESWVEPVTCHIVLYRNCFS